MVSHPNLQELQTLLHAFHRGDGDCHHAVGLPACNHGSIAGISVSEKVASLGCVQTAPNHYRCWEANSHVLIHSPHREILSQPCQVPDSITKSHVQTLLPEIDQSCLLNESLSWNNADIETRLQNHAQSQDNTSGVAVSYSVIWSTKPPRPAVIQEVWKKAKLALISKAAEQVQAWQQALRSYWTLENTGIRNRQGGKKK